MGVHSVSGFWGGDDVIKSCVLHLLSGKGCISRVVGSLNVDEQCSDVQCYVYRQLSSREQGNTSAS